MQNILLLGGNGYIGSRLKQVLSDHHLVTSVDIGWFGPQSDSIVMDYRNLTARELDAYQVIILLAGHSSVKTCDGPIQAPWLNNVTNFIDLVNKTSPQLIIYASSASVYGNSLPGQAHIEHIEHFKPVNNYDVTKYVLDQHAELALRRGHRLVGLRFGTVNGWAPTLRTDVMINAMYETAIRSGTIQVTNSHISRAILGIEDLCRAIKACIDQPTTYGIYNLASFNITVGELAQQVADQLDVKLVDNGIVGNAYDFSLSTDLFEEVYDFKFSETPSSILSSLVDKYHTSRPQRRDQYIYYDWTQKNEIE